MTESEDKFNKALQHLERIFNNLNQHWHSIQLLLGHVSKPLVIDDRGLANVLKKFTEDLGNFMDEMRKFDFAQAAAEIKYIGKRVNGIEQLIQDIKTQGVEKKVRVDLTLDGYEMVRKKKLNEIFEDEKETFVNVDAQVENILKTLEKREAEVLIHRFGLLGEKKKTLETTGEIIGLTRESIRRIVAKALRKLRHPVRVELVHNCDHLVLKEAVLGK
jgi:RNA polymerase sigma factor (sigma-70 family)